MCFVLIPMNTISITGTLNIKNHITVKHWSQRLVLVRKLFAFMSLRCLLD